MPAMRAKGPVAGRLHGTGSIGAGAPLLVQSGIEGIVAGVKFWEYEWMCIDGRNGRLAGALSCRRRARRETVHTLESAISGGCMPAA